MKKPTNPLRKLLRWLIDIRDKLIRFDLEAQEAYRLEDEQHRKDNDGLSLSMMI